MRPLPFAFLTVALAAANPTKHHPAGVGRRAPNEDAPPPTPALGRRATSSPTITTAPPLFSGICTDPFYHVETINGYFFAPWLGCDSFRPQCCPPDYPAYAFTVGTEAPTATASDFRLASCPDGFSLGKLPTHPASVSGVCCPPSFTPLPSTNGDWFQSGAMCYKTMNASERRASASSTWKAVFNGDQFSIVGGSFVTAPPRFSSRFVALGYYLDPQATTAGGSSVSVTGTGTGTGLGATAACTAPALASVAATTEGIKAGAVAGVALGAVFTGAAVGAAVVWFLFGRRRRAEAAGVGGYVHTQVPGEMCGAESVKELVAPVEMDVNVRRELPGAGQK